MPDNDKTRGQLIIELNEMRQRIAKLEASKIKSGCALGKIKQQNMFLNDIFNAIVYPLCVLDASDYRIKMANKAAKVGCLGNNPTCYTSIYRRSEPCGGVNFVCPLEEVKKIKKTVIVERIRYGKDGSARNIEVQGYPIFDAKGNVTQVIICLMDITGRKQAEEKLRLQSKIAVNMTEGVCLVGLDDAVIRYANLKFEKMFGYGPGEMIGKHVSIINAPTYKHPEETAKEIMEIIYRTGEWHGEVNNIKKDGTPFWCYANVSEFKHSEYGKVLVAVHTDITERKQAEEEISKFKTMSDQAPWGTAISNLKGRLLYVNESYARMLGYTPDELIGKSTSIHFPDEERETLLRRRRQMIKTGNYITGERWRKRKDGSVFLTHTTVKPVTDEKGRVIFATSMVIDITERKQAEIQRITSQKELRSLASQLSLAEEHERRRIAMELHNGVSQTLAVCRMKLGALMESAPSIFSSELLGEIHTLIKKLIGETRLLTSELSSPLLYELGLEAAVEDLVEKMAAQHGIQCNFKSDGNASPLNEDIRILLFQAVRELLNNVVKHAQARHARVRMKTYKKNLKITIGDDGIGCDYSHISRGSKTVTGFGLFNIRERLHHIGGKMEIKSEPGCGTGVTISVPLMPE